MLLRAARFLHQKLWRSVLTFAVVGPVAHASHLLLGDITRVYEYFNCVLYCIEEVPRGHVLKILPVLNHLKIAACMCHMLYSKIRSRNGLSYCWFGQRMSYSIGQRELNFRNFGAVVKQKLWWYLCVLPLKTSWLLGVCVMTCVFLKFVCLYQKKCLFSQGIPVGIKTLCSFVKCVFILLSYL